MLSPTRALLLCAVLQPITAAEPRFAWQDPQVTVLANGDLALRQRPFRFTAGASLRYIDFEQGSDDADGRSTATAWKHHPWDAQASGVARSGAGRHTYVFKRGVWYRGSLLASGSGSADEPIRLTSDPAWGSGEAVIAGSERLSGWKQGGPHKIKTLPEADKVWSIEVPWLPRCAWWFASDGSATRLPLARTPNWTVTDWDDIKSNWYAFDNPKKSMGNFLQGAHGKMNLGIDTKNVDPAKGEEYYKDALIWPEWGYVIGTPFPAVLREVDFKSKGLAFGGKWGASAGTHILRGNRYYLEDKPQYLDDASGEFWCYRRKDSAIMYLRLPDGVDPNRERIEVARHLNLIDSRSLDQVEISGLTFRCTNVFWNLEALPDKGPDVDPAAIRILGSASGIRVVNCTFQDVNKALFAKASATGGALDDLAFNDNLVERTDHDAVCMFDGAEWGDIAPGAGQLLDLEILRNRFTLTGMRPTRYGSGHTTHINAARTAHIAGNVIERVYGSGIHIFGGKSKSLMTDVPYVRLLIHHNKVKDGLLNTCDWGNIETWQGGPAYVFNNVSINPGGYWHYNFVHQSKNKEHANARFGHAYYLDGGYKNFLFNNIAVGGATNALVSRLTCTAAFQEILGHQCAFFNNTAYRFLTGSRRQRPEAGRNLYLGNVFDDISWMVFMHSETPKKVKAGNDADAGDQGDGFAYDTMGYGNNVLHRTAITGQFDAQAIRHQGVAEMAAALAAHGALVSGVGEHSARPPLLDPAQGDFRPAGAATDGKGVRVFVPWGLSREVGEWNFLRSASDASVVVDDHWNLPAYKVNRIQYKDYPTYPLRGIGISASDYVQGALEDFHPGAVRLDGVRQYFVISDSVFNASHTHQKPTKPSLKESVPEVIPAEVLQSPEVHTGNLLIEAYVTIPAGQKNGILVSKMGAVGYRLGLDASGRLSWTLSNAGGSATLTSPASIATGAWTHLVVEADRSERSLRMYLNGVEVARGPGIDHGTLASDADLYVGGSPTGGHLAMTIDALRMAQGTLAEAGTSIEELSAWQFDGPFLRDFTGRPAQGAGRDAGAIEGGPRR